MSLSQSLSITVNSLKNNQYALTVVSQNVANVNTEGYTKKTVNFTESVVSTYGSDVYSVIKGLNGSTITGIVDYLDEAALAEIASAQSDADYYNTLSDALSGLEDIVDALGDDGLNALLNEFYTAAANLEQYPDDLTVRQLYVAAAQSVCEKFNEIASSLDDYEDSLISEAQDSVDIVNSLLSQIADANQTYLTNGKSTTTLSEIYSLIQELSSYVNVTTEENSNGTINIYIGNIRVVHGSSLDYTLEVDSDTSGESDNVLTFSLKSTEDEDYVITKGVNDAITSGSLGAISEFLNGTSDSYYNIDDIRDALNEAANAFATELNAIQTYDDGEVFAASITTVDGVTQLTKSTTAMFTSSDGEEINASNIQVNSEILENAYLVAAARIDSTQYEDDEWTLAVGDSSNVAEIIDLQNQKICDYGGEEDNCTLSDFLAALAAKIGSDTDSAATKAETYQSILDDALTNYSNLTGVNLDEEIADLLKYQRAYEASAEVFSIINGLYDTILDMV